MAYHKVFYDKLFPYAPYLNERIGIEIMVETGQNPLEALEEARNLVHDFRNKHIQEELSHQYEPSLEQIPDVQVQKTTIDYIIDDIMKCPTIQELESFKVIAASKPELQMTYDFKLNQLSK